MLAEKKIDYTLPNGLQVLLIQDPTASLVSSRLYVRAGSIHEERWLGGGLSHYLEHLVAGGSTSVRGEKDYESMVSKMGGASNAYTTTDHTSYYINSTPENIKQTITILNEWMFDCNIDPKEFDRERSVITREIEKNLANISRQFYQLSQRHFYKIHPIRMPVIGFLETFKQVQRQDVVDYYNKMYVPRNMILVIGGHFNVDEVRAHIHNTFGKRLDYAAPSSPVFDEPYPFNTRFLEESGDTATTYLSIRFATVDLYSSDLYPLDLLDFILSNGEDSLLYTSLVEDQKLAYSVRASSYTPNETTGYFDITFEIDYDKKDAVQKALYDILDQIKAGRFDQKRLERARKQKLADDILGVDTIEDKVARVGQSFLYGYSPNFFEDYVKNFKHVDHDDVVRVAKQYLDYDRAVISLLKPKVEASQVATADAGIGSLLPQQPIKKTLANGVRVLLYPDHSLPRAHAKVFVLGGVRGETVSTNGLGTLVADLLGKGSPRYSKDQIREEIEGVGASLYGSLGNNTLYYNLDSLSDDFPSLLPLFCHTFLEPVFKQDDMDDTRRRVLKSISKRQDDWFSYGSYFFKKTFFNDHPYGLSLLGESEIISAFTVADVEAHYQHFMDPKQMVLTIFGDFDSEAVMRTLEDTFGRYRSGEETFDATTKLERKPNLKTHSETVDIPQNVAGLFVGFDGATFADKSDVLKLDLLDAVLSGTNYPGGRLHPLLRGKGYVYMVHAVHHVGIEKGYFLVYALTTQDKVAEVKTLILDQIKDLQTRLVSDDEFNEAILQMKYSSKDHVSSLSSLSLVSATDELYGRGYDFHYGMDSKIDQLTKEDVRDMAKKYLKAPQSYLFVGSE